MRIEDGGLSNPLVIALLQTHVTRARAETAVGSAHALDLSGLAAPGISFWTIWEEDALLGCGALNVLTADHGEVKSMHVAEHARGHGVAGRMLRHIMDVAGARAMVRLSLETGSWAYFAPARALYARHGFVMCEAFAPYVADTNSVFMTVGLEF